MLNLVIVDDEITVLKGLRKILSKHCPEYRIAHMAQNPLEALRIMEHTKVDVVITDIKMPDMDGIELTKLIRNLYPSVAVIVLSGYPDFEFVRQALKLGAHDYLLKPCSYQTVVDLLRNIESQVRQREEETQQMTMKRMLEEVVSGKRELPEEWIAFKHMQAVVIKSRACGEPLLEEHVKQAVAQAGAADPLIEVIGIDEHYVLLFSDPLDILKMNSLHSIIRSKGFRIFMACVSFLSGSECVEKTYSKCLEMVQYLEFNELSIAVDVQTYSNYFEQQKKVTLQDYFSSQELVKLIMNGQYGKAREVVSTNLNRLDQLNVYMDPIRMKKEVLKQIISLEHLLKEHGIDFERITENQVDVLTELENVTVFRNVLIWLKKFTMGIVMSMENGNHMPHYIMAAVQYIDKHYMKDIFLKTISEEVYVNPWYLSAQFKKYVGVTFGEYVNQTRVRKAKEFLKQKDLKVYQVAEMVGFQDAAYFSTVFKSLENISPKEYQKII
jgi:two-component system response regulator YesN